ncbi:GNAT family N-acetyltransferase [Haloarchaeobius salinus]|uniref:GNAT family N-acetyltransferase n=1 Tax=Haloarchaeobius salinus TaxID=1198298 RepID=UPI002108B10D|nr:GNAT family protein [Haloarchaeobius salinus]
MPGAVFLEGDDVDLCTIEKADAAFVTEALNDPEVRVPLGIAEPKNETQHEEWIEEQVSSDEGFNLLVVADDEPIGVINSNWLSERHGHAVMSAWLAADAQGQGYGADATSTFVDFLMNERRMQTVRAEAFAFNEASNAMLQSIGMERVGSIPNWAFVDGEYHDSHIYAVTAEQWRNRR